MQLAPFSTSHQRGRLDQQPVFALSSKRLQSPSAQLWRASHTDLRNWTCCRGNSAPRPGAHITKMWERTLRENSEVANLSVLSFFPSQNWVSNHVFTTSAARRLLRMTPSSNLHYHSSQTNDILVSCPCPITSWKITASHAPDLVTPLSRTLCGCLLPWVLTEWGLVVLQLEIPLSPLHSLSLLQIPVCVLFLTSQVLFLLLTFELLSDLHLNYPQGFLLPALESELQTFLMLTLTTWQKLLLP